PGSAADARSPTRSARGRREHLESAGSRSPRTRRSQGSRAGTPTPEGLHPRPLAIEPPDRPAVLLQRPSTFRSRPLGRKARGRDENDPSSDPRSPPGVRRRKAEGKRGRVMNSERIAELWSRFAGGERLTPAEEQELHSALCADEQLRLR